MTDLVINVNLIKEFGNEVATYISGCIALYNEAKFNGTLVLNGYFKCTQKDVYEITALSNYHQRQCLHLLTDLGYVTVIDTGDRHTSRAGRFFKLDLRRIYSIMYPNIGTKTYRIIGRCKLSVQDVVYSYQNSCVEQVNRFILQICLTFDLITQREFESIDVCDSERVLKILKSERVKILTQSKNFQKNLKKRVKNSNNSYRFKCELLSANKHTDLYKLSKYIGVKNADLYTLLNKLVTVAIFNPSDLKIATYYNYIYLFIFNLTNNSYKYIQYTIYRNFYYAKALKRESEVISVSQRKANTYRLLRESVVQSNQQKLDKQKKPNMYAKCVKLIYEFTDDSDLIDSLIQFLNLRIEMSVGAFYVNQWKGLLNGLQNITLQYNYSVKQQNEVVQQSIIKGWKSFYPLHENYSNGYNDNIQPDNRDLSDSKFDLSDLKF